jgi:uracil phosphoribosyltransferase
MFHADVMVASFKANPASVISITVDEETGEERKRYINRMRWKGYGPVSIFFTDPVVCTGSSILTPLQDVL